MRKLIALGVILLFSALAFAGSAEASHEKYTFRYVGGGGSGFGVLLTSCVWDVGDETLSLGGACFTPCPHGSCTITVVDDTWGPNVWFRIQVDDEPFFRPNVYNHQTTVDAERVRVAIVVSDATTGIITIE
ncbi:MAG: hypothetical protein KY455_14055 [Euryarchaeota archaeon]|nr:hypothetical protein [Euryarchaeota archaeon]